MKKYFLYQLIGLMLILLATMSGCEIEKKLEGSGIVTTERRVVQDFQEIEINGVLNVYLKQGALNKVEVKTDDNLQGIVEIKSNNGILYVNTKTNSNFDATQMDIYITVKNINYLKLDGVTALYTEGIISLDVLTINKVNTGYMSFSASLNKLFLTTDGAGDLTLTGKADITEIENAMVGNLHAYGFKTRDLTVIHSGTGVVEVFATERITIDITGVGDIYCKGSPPNISKLSESVVGHLFMVE